jgi:hypothetical protein
LTKLLRWPSRVALGNGLRVNASAVPARSPSSPATGGSLAPQGDGSTRAVEVTPVDHPIVPRVEIKFTSTWRARVPQR